MVANNMMHWSEIYTTYKSHTKKTLTLTKNKQNKQQMTRITIVKLAFPTFCKTVFLFFWGLCFQDAVLICTLFVLYFFLLLHLYIFFFDCTIELGYLRLNTDKLAYMLYRLFPLFPDHGANPDYVSVC